MGSLITAEVVPEVVPGLQGVELKFFLEMIISYPWEERVVVFVHHKTTLFVVIVRFTVSPVEELNILVHMRPRPVALIVVWVVSSLELDEFGFNRVKIQLLRHKWLQAKTERILQLELCPKV